MTTHATAQALLEGLSAVIRGKKPELELFLASFLTGGHVLIEDYPGLGKTTLGKTLAKLISHTPDKGSRKKKAASVSFRRIQFTPDLLPYDITGVEVFNPKDQRFEFIPGPVFCDILLADEINRATPKVQSALLEVMAERQVTLGGETRAVSPLFFVVATQNPVDALGTYALPAAQLDRFMLRLSLGYPDHESELGILMGDPSERILPLVQPVVSSADVQAAREAQSTVFSHPALNEAILEIVRRTREHPALKLGVSPRGALALLHAARSLALIRGRTWIEDSDIRDLSVPVLAHRIMAKDSRTDCGSVIAGITGEIVTKTLKRTDWSKDVSLNAKA